VRGVPPRLSRLSLEAAHARAAPAALCGSKMSRGPRRSVQGLGARRALKFRDKGRGARVCKNACRLFSGDAEGVGLLMLLVLVLLLLA
jgi:hypothetical protein